jgi:GTP-binding protein HflX
LREAFLATLEELDAADVLVQVADAHHPELAEHIDAVQTLLQELGLNTIPRLLVFNKWDLVDSAQRLTLQNRYPRALPISAKDKFGLDQLLQAIESQLPFRDIPRQRLCTTVTWKENNSADKSL